MGTEIRSSVRQARGHMEMSLPNTSPSSAYFCALAAFRIMSRWLLSAAVKTYGMLHAEKIACEEEALRLVSRYAFGSMRDGQSIIEQAAVSGDGRIQASLVEEILGRNNFV